MTRPARLEDSATDQSTEPSEAFRVSVPPFRPSTIVVGVTVRMPRLGDELAVAVALLVLGARELGLALELDGGAEAGGDGCPLLPGEPGLVADPRSAARCRPRRAAAHRRPPGDTFAAPFADTVGCGRLLDPPLPGPPGVPPAAAMLVPGPDPGPSAAAPPPGWPGPEAASATASSVTAATTAAAAAAAAA